MCASLSVFKSAFMFVSVRIPVCACSSIALISFCVSCNETGVGPERSGSVFPFDWRFSGHRSNETGPNYDKKVVST